MLDLNPGPLPQKSGALPNEPPYLQMRLILYRSGTVRGRGTKEQLITIHPGLRQILGCIRYLKVVGVANLFLERELQHSDGVVSLLPLDGVFSFHPAASEEAAAAAE